MTNTFLAAKNFFSKMENVITLSLFFLAAGILTSVSILSAYQVLFFIPLIYCSIRVLKQNQGELPISAWFLFAFAAMALLGLIINFELLPRPGKNFGRLKYYLYGLGGIYVFQYWLQRASSRTKRFLVNVFLVSVIVAGLKAIYSYATLVPGERVRSFTDTMRYGYGSSMLLLALLSGLLQRERTKEWLNLPLGIIALLIGFLGMYFTYTRGGLLGFLCGLPFAIYFFRPKLGITIGGIALAIVLTLGGFYFFGKIEKGKGSRFLMSKENNSDVVRRSQWKAAIIATKEKPLLGWGLSNFHSQLRRIKRQYDLDAKDYDDAHAHNLFLEVASGTGIIGLLLFLGWLIAWASEAFRRKGLVRAIVVPFGVAFVVSSQFEVTFDANNASMIFFLYAISSSRSKNVE